MSSCGVKYKSQLFDISYKLNYIGHNIRNWESICCYLLSYIYIFMCLHLFKWNLSAMSAAVFHSQCRNTIFLWKIRKKKKYINLRGFPVMQYLYVTPKKPFLPTAEATTMCNGFYPHQCSHKLGTVISIKDKHLRKKVVQCCFYFVMMFWNIWYFAGKVPGPGNNSKRIVNKSLIIQCDAKGKEKKKKTNQNQTKPNSTPTKNTRRQTTKKIFLSFPDFFFQGKMKSC